MGYLMVTFKGISVESVTVVKWREVLVKLTLEHYPKIQNGAQVRLWKRHTSARVDIVMKTKMHIPHNIKCQNTYKP